MTPVSSLLTRTLKMTSTPARDIYGAKRVVYHYLKRDMHKLNDDPINVQNRFGVWFLPLVIAARKKAGLKALPAVIDQALWSRMVHAGAIYAFEVDIMNRYIDQLPKKPNLVFPVPQGQMGQVCQGLHQTAGIPGNWAIDFCCPDNTGIVAVEAGTVTKLSGHSPSQDTWDTQGVFGWSVHFETAARYHYFVTHLGERNVQVGMKVGAGDLIGRVGDQKYRPDHCHYGVSSPLGETDAKKRITDVSNAPRID